MWGSATTTGLAEYGCGTMVQASIPWSSGCLRREACAGLEWHAECFLMCSVRHASFFTFIPSMGARTYRLQNDAALVSYKHWWPPVVPAATYGQVSDLVSRQLPMQVAMHSASTTCTYSLCSTCSAYTALQGWQHHSLDKCSKK
jgi:hypothetical protein